MRKLYKDIDIYYLYLCIYIIVDRCIEVYLWYIKFFDIFIDIKR